MNQNPQVSVIIPNYNYARFLQRRIDSIANQTIKPAEIIFLDDCSTDNSLEVAEKILSNTCIPYRIISNEINQGVFKQWLKGIELVENDYFWIAEADDYCELNFLETLLPSFEDEDVVISYCQSLAVDKFGMQNTQLNRISTEIDAARLCHSYVTGCDNEANSLMVIISVIANIGSTIIRRKSVSMLWANQIAEFKMAGDWFFYLLLLYNNSNKKISYFAGTLNYWYQHEGSIWGDDTKRLLGYTECLRIWAFCLREFDVQQESKAKILSRLFKHFLNQPNSDGIYIHKIIEVLVLLGEQTYTEQIRELVKRHLSLSVELSILHQECGNRDNEINRLNNELSNVNNELSNERSEVSRLHYEIHLRNVEIERLNNHIGAIYATISWKITQPIRLFKKGIKKIISMHRQLALKIKSRIKSLIIKIAKKIATINIVKRMGKSYLNKHPELKMKIKQKMIAKGLWNDKYMPISPLPLVGSSDREINIEQVRQQYGNDVANIYQILTKKK